MSDDTNLSMSQNDPIGLDPQLMGGSQNQTITDLTPPPPPPDPIGLDPNLSILFQKSQNPELVALDPRLTSQVIENHFGVEESTNQVDSSQSSSTEQAS